MDDKKHHEVFSGKWYAHPVMRNALIAAIITILTFGLRHIENLIPSSVEIVLFGLAIIIGGYHWIREGIEELIEEKKIGIEILMMAATIGSAVLGMWDEAAFLVVIYGVAEGLEEYAYARTRSSIRQLLDLAPREAHLLKNEKEITVPATELLVGDIFIVRPGESIATDGVIRKGKSSVNEAPVTGESVPVEKQVGAKVFAATINQEGMLEVQVTAAFADNTLSKMIRMVEEAQDKKSKTQLFIERFGKIYSPLVLLGGLLLIGIPFFLGQPLAFWGIRAVVFLVAAAPCALIMSTPVAVAAGIGTAGKNGVLIKGGIHLENLGKITAIAFDKTGTLTIGKPVVTDIIPLRGTPEELLQLAASIEQFSEHPLARAVMSKAHELTISPLEAQNFNACIGSGVQAQLQNKVGYVGSQDFFSHADQTFIKKTEGLRSEGKTVIYVGLQNELYGAIAVRDELRPNAPRVIKALQNHGIKVIMLTGDTSVTAEAINRELGIDDVRAHLKPEDKLTIIEQLKKEYKTVAMVGDGINDAPALASATVGIAMGAAGTDVAIEAADVALMADDITKIEYALHLGRTAHRISRQNIIFSLLLLAVLIPAALFGVLSIAIAVSVHEVGELLAVANGLRVARKTRPHH